MKEPEQIVAEVSRCYVNGESTSDDKLPVSKLFEHCIQVNRERGYHLHSWRFVQTYERSVLVETIIAVFEKRT